MKKKLKPKHLEFIAIDTVTGEELDIADAAEMLNTNIAAIVRKVLLADKEIIIAARDGKWECAFSMNYKER